MEAVISGNLKNALKTIKNKKPMTTKTNFKAVVIALRRE